MKINDTRKRINYQFGELEQGYVFMEDNEYYLKTCEVKDEDLGVTYNAVHLQSGILVSFNDDKPITVLNAELTIK